MLEIEQAREIITAGLSPLNPVIHPVSSTILGYFLGEDILADLDSPPFPKALMDGFAVRANEAAPGKALALNSMELSAGMAVDFALPPGCACPIMTGAPIPFGANSVVPLEFAKTTSTQVEFITGEINSGWNILPQGAEYKSGEKLLQTGDQITSQNIGILAACGKTSAFFHPAPKVAIVATGNEMVEPNQTPGPAQIRNSNATMLGALISESEGMPKYLGRAEDTEKSLEGIFQEAFTLDVAIITGGVSTGRLDLVPKVLSQMGVEILFHKINMKPGKPMLFGRTSRGTPVFALPGNPVSAFVCFHLFIRPALLALRGGKKEQREIPAALTQGLDYHSDRPTLHPACLKLGQVNQVTPATWFGSADMLSLSRANALIFLPAEKSSFAQGEVVRCLPTIRHLV